MKKSSPWKTYLIVSVVLIAVSSGVIYYLGGAALFKKFDVPVPVTDDPTTAEAKASVEATQEARNEQAQQQIRDEMTRLLVDSKISRDEYNAYMAKLDADQQEAADEQAQSEAQLQAQLNAVQQQGQVIVIQQQSDGQIQPVQTQDITPVSLQAGP